MLLREDCRVGMEVVFGRDTGENTKGVIVKLNRAKAKVRTTEARGNHPAGATWSVPYAMLNAIGADGQVEVRNVVEKPIPYNQFQPHIDQLILEAICGVYNGLSPENLTGDGELPVHVVRSRRDDLHRKLTYLQKAYGRTVSETVAYDWLDAKIKSRGANTLV